MQTRWLSEKMKYDGTQLRPLFAYLGYGILGDSVVAWRGACDVSFTHMVDGEDLLAQAQICGDEMLHFIFEIFDQPLSVGVFLQRLFASQAKDILEAGASGAQLTRQGDDLFYKDGKLSISIATKSVNSVLVHFALNIVNTGTPVKTSCLQDLKVEPQAFAQELMKLVSAEYQDIKNATYKIRTV